jgi:hypothetical protein
MQLCGGAGCGGAVCVEDEPEPPPQAVSKPAREIASAMSSTAMARLRRKRNGAPSNTTHSINAPPPVCRPGACFAALVVAEIVSTVEPLPPLVKISEGALAFTRDGSELVMLKATVPA